MAALGAAAAPPALMLVSPYLTTTVCPELSAEGTVMSIVHGPEPAIAMLPTATAEPPLVAVT